MKKEPQSTVLPSWLLLILAAILMTAAPVAAGSIDEFRSHLSDNYRTDLNGFIETRAGVRLQNDPHQKDASLGETRLQLDLASDLPGVILKIKADLLADLVTEEAVAELRELNFLFSPLQSMDVKLGRQVLTWGTGDLLFINDLFPKDWESFFIGRDDEYLKAPSDALKVSIFPEIFSMDLVYSPVFKGSRYIDGSRISYWNSLLGRTAGRDFIFADEEPNSLFSDDEFHGRIFRNFGGVEVAGYGYRGFWSTPEGVIPSWPRLFYPRLSVYGLSGRMTVLGGIGNVEAGYYDSREDRDGSNPLVRNSEARFLAGFERELARNLTGSLQYYLEYMQDYEEYERTLPAGMVGKDEYRHVLTVRITRLLMNQNLRFSLFAYYSPSDEDGYLRPKASYKVTDKLAVEGGLNYFFGRENHTFFGQFEDASNIYAGIRYNF